MSERSERSERAEHASVIYPQHGGRPLRLDIVEVVNRLHEEIGIVVGEDHEYYFYEDGVYKKTDEALILGILGEWYGDMKNYQEKPLLNRNVVAEILMLLKAKYRVNKNMMISEDYINLKNGLYNFREGVLEEHHRNVFQTVQLPIKYEEEADCPTILEILEDVINNQLDVLLDFMAYTLFYHGHPIQKALMLVGPTGTGKSVILNLFRRFYGEENISNVPLEYLDGENAERYIAELYGKVLNVAGELPSKRINVERFKSATSGSDYISGRYIYKKPFKFVNKAKMVFASNTPPIINDYSDAFYRRLIILECVNQVELTDHNIKRLKAIDDQQELSGLLNILLPRLKRVLSTLRLCGDDLDLNKSIYRRHSDSLDMFIEEVIEITDDPKDFVSIQNLFERYKEYCEHYKVPMRVKNAIGFSKILRQYFIDGYFVRKRIDSRVTRGIAGARIARSARV